MNAPQQPLVIEALALLAKKWGGHDVRSEPEEGDEGGDAGELVPGREIRLTQIPLEDNQLDHLVGQLASRVFFNTQPNRPPEPAFSSFSKIRLDDKYKNCEVLITFGVSNNQVKIEKATIKNLALKFAKAGKAELSCTIVGARPRSIDLLDLEDFAGKPVNVWMSFGPMVRSSDQQALPLEGGGATEASTVDKTRVLAPGQAEREAELSEELREKLRAADHDRQLEEAAQHHENEAAKSAA